MGSGALARPCLVRRSSVTLVVLVHIWSLPLSWGHGTMVRCKHGAGGERGCRSHSYPWAKVVYHAEGERGSHARVGLVSPTDTKGAALTRRPVPAYPLVCRLV